MLNEATDSETHKSEYSYDKDNRVTQVKYDGSDSTKVDYTYDKLNRITQRSVTNGATYATQYGYTQGASAYGTNATTPLINSIAQGSGVNALNFSYTYDSRGNITSETRNGVTTTYEYDALGQLTRVNDPNDPTAYNEGAPTNTGTTWLYTYDRGGNILSKAAYAYTAGSVGTAVRTWLYEYNDSNWKDKLTKFDGKTITYDAIGNPLSDGTWSYTWQAGRQLKNMSKVDGNDTITIEFTYNHAGLRTKKVKKVNGTVTETTEYILNGKNVVELVHTDNTTGTTPTVNTLHFFYDTQDKQAIVEFNGIKYSYAYNLQGDVIGIVDNTGTIVVQYSYDAWGKPIATTSISTLTTELVELNPFRYRGYVFDKETNLYYLRSRYYSSFKCKFAVSDSRLFGNSTLSTALNTFTYCSNRPVQYYDRDGKQESECSSAANSIEDIKQRVIFIEDAVYYKWQDAEADLRIISNSVDPASERAFYTPYGERRVDSYNKSTGIIAEGKLGYAYLSYRIRLEVSKDTYLLETGAVDGVEWHFFINGNSNGNKAGGPSKPLLEALLNSGFTVVFHDNNNYFKQKYSDYLFD